MGESYPEMKEQVSLEDKVGKHTPKTFLWHTFTDPVVPFWNSFRFAEAVSYTHLDVYKRQLKYGVTLHQVQQMTTERNRQY